MQLILTERRWFRFFAFTAFYFAQGVPIGLLSVAIPKWLGVGVGEVAAYLAAVSLPWAFKLVAGPFMDRFTFRPMGFRRPWVLAAQGGLTLSLIGLAFIGDPRGGDLLGLIVAGFIVNSFAATQDVAVDGMAIDVLPEDERGRANAFMAFGQVAGFAAYGALCGALLSVIGLAATALVCALTVALIFLLVAVLRERPGERLLPWSVGQAAAGEHDAEPSIKAIFADLIRVLLLPMSLVLTLLEFLNRVRDGIASAVQPVFAEQQLQLSDATYTLYVGFFSFGAAVAGALCGPLVDRLGAQRFLMAGLIGSAVCHLWFGLVPSQWSNMPFVIAMAIVSQVFGQLIFIAIIALYMNMCWTKVSATQFAIYMSLSNLSRSAGAAMLALVGGALTFEASFLIMGTLLAASAAVLWFFDLTSHQARIEALDHEDVGELKAAV